MARWAGDGVLVEQVVMPAEMHARTGKCSLPLLILMQLEGNPGEKRDRNGNWPDKALITGVNDSNGETFMKQMDNGKTILRVNRLDLNGSVADGPGLRLVVFLQGCDKKVKCAFCHNPSSHLLAGGTAMAVGDIVSKLLKSPIRKVTLSGGEPLAQGEGLLCLLDALKENGFEIALYTWRPKDQVPGDVLNRIDWLKVGEYRHELRTSTTPFVGSLNQKFLRVA